jgi:hypothetical protein
LFEWTYHVFEHRDDSIRCLVCDVETFSDKLDAFFGRGCSDCRPWTIEAREDDFRGREREGPASRR